MARTPFAPAIPPRLVLKLLLGLLALAAVELLAEPGVLPWDRLFAGASVARAEDSAPTVAVKEGPTVHEAARSDLSRTPANETSAAGASANGTSANETSANGTSANGTSANGTSANGTSANGTSANGTSADFEAPALATTSSAQSTQRVEPSRVDPARQDVLGDLGRTMSRPAGPAAGTNTPAVPPAGQSTPTPAPAAAAQAAAPSAWHGYAGQDVYRRAAPNRANKPLGMLIAGTPVDVVDWVSGEEVETENTTWAQLSDGSYVFSTALRRAPLVAPPAPPSDAPTTGRWIDVNLHEQVATAYEGRTAVRSVLISTGRPGWDTPRGTFAINRRVANETMDGSTLAGQGPNGAGATYKVENVRYTQYFTDDGAAIHENYWRRPATFGMPGSHGCIGLLSADAAWFWDFATVGTPVIIHD
ncbi:MAG: L,D-transpeptidase [Chloroflexi bacterium]|nr:L,D-transpeptidase [Chloroflexota bacterium]